MGISLGLGLVSAIWFSEPIVTAKAVAAVTLLAAFVSNRAGRFLAAVTRAGAGRDRLVRDRVAVRRTHRGHPARRESGRRPPGGRSPSAPSTPGSRPVPASAVRGPRGPASGRFDMAAIGADSSGVWHLAVAALAVLAVRRMTDLCYERATEGTGGRTRLPRSGGRRRIERALTLPAGERAVLIIVAGGIWGPRVAFLNHWWGGVAATGYLLTARLVGLRDAMDFGGRSASAMLADRRRGIDQPGRGGLVAGVLGARPARTPAPAPARTLAPTRTAQGPACCRAG